MLKKFKLSVDHKEALVLMLFSLLLFETLTVATVIFVLIGGILVFLGVNPGLIFRHLTALGLFGVYWFTYGKLIDPEVGLNFLTSIMVVKLLEKETARDRYMIFFGLMLLISSGALFQKSLSYVLFFGLSFYVLIQDFYIELGLPAKFKNLFKLIIWILPFTIFLFVFVPRMMSPFQIKSEVPQSGEIGYTPDVNISTIETLTGNDNIVFQASIIGNIRVEHLYWRGNTVSSTDGWNWFASSADQSIPVFSKGAYDSQGFIRQKMRVFGNQEYFFALDFPLRLITSLGHSEFSDASGLKQLNWQRSQRYEALSSGKSSFESSFVSDQNRFLKNGVRQRDASWIENNFKENNLEPLLMEIKHFFLRENFSYSLSPGKVESFSNFMKKKKVGFCSHFASATGLILRAKGFQARLVSGFLGGTYNQYGNFYQITQNDAHAWLEIFDKGNWIRVDPTDWIAPDRIKLGGEAFVQMNSSNRFRHLNFLKPYLGQIDDLKKWLLQWDYKFYNFLEAMDYEGQRAFFEKFKIKKDWIFTIIPVMLIFFSILFSIHLLRLQGHGRTIEKLWFKFSKKMKSRGIEIEFNSLSEIKDKIKNEDKITQDVFDQLIQVTYSGKKMSDLKNKINRI